MSLGCFGGMDTLVSRYLASPEGKEAIRKYLASPEGIAMIQNYISTPEGKKTAISILPSLLDGLNLPQAVRDAVTSAIGKSA